MKKLLIIITFLLINSPINAATYYMATTGNDSTGDGSSGAPWLTLQKSMIEMIVGDTLIVRDGIYATAANMIDTAHCPPNGTAWTEGNHTTIRAENDGQAIFDGENTRMMLGINNYPAAVNLDRYWKFEGIEWINSSEAAAYCRYANHVKFLRCGARDGADGIYSTWQISESSYITLDGCYSYGNGRYKFIAYLSDHIIFRSCVARADRIDTEYAPGVFEASCIYQMYSVDQGLVQNCIAIDSDQTDYYNVHATEHYGAFGNAATLQDGDDITYRNCIGLNVRTGATTSSSNATARADSVFFNNCVLWDCWDAINNDWVMNYHQGTNGGMEHCTLGVAEVNSGVAGYYISNYCSAEHRPNNNDYRNNIFYGITGTGSMWFTADQGTTQDYNYYFGNTISTNNRSGAHDHTDVNFLWAAGNTSGGLKYLPRIEPTSNLSGIAGDDGDIGANLTYLWGATGSEWDESGYDTETSTAMWPFPNETLIKTKMAAWSYDDGSGGDPEISGARGFAAAGKQLNGSDDITLTSYIWEYLGNEIPSDIYGEEEPAAASNTTCTGCTGVGVTFN